MQDDRDDYEEFDEEDYENNDQEIHRVSKSQLKRDSHARQALGEQLVKLNGEQLRQFDLPENLLQAIKTAQTIKQHGAKKRQLQYIGKLMRAIDVEPIQDKLDDLQGVSAQAIAAQHKIELWRQRLIEEGDGALEALCAEYPQIDRQRVRQLLRNVQKEAQQNKPPKALRELFKYLRQCLIEAG